MLFPKATKLFRLEIKIFLAWYDEADYSCAVQDH